MLNFIVEELKPVYDYINGKFKEGSEYIVVDSIFDLFKNVDYMLLRYIIYRDKTLYIREEFVKERTNKYFNEYKEVIVNPSITEYRVICCPVKYEKTYNDHRDFTEVGVVSKIEEAIDLIEEEDDVLFSNLKESNIILGKKYIWEVRKIRKGEKK